MFPCDEGLEPHDTLTGETQNLNFQPLPWNCDPEIFDVLRQYKPLSLAWYLAAYTKTTQ